MKSQLEELVRLLDDVGTSDTVVTSIRQPVQLRAALRLAVEMGMDTNSNEAANRALLARLEAFAQSRALEEHFRQHPAARPSLAEVALRLAELEGSPLADQPRVIAQAAAEVSTRRPLADADDVLIWAESMLAHGWTVSRLKPAR